MALIKCEECGKEISDKAKECIHCGCPIEEMKKLQCEECGNVLKENESVCSKCGCPVECIKETNTIIKNETIINKDIKDISKYMIKLLDSKYAKEQKRNELKKCILEPYIKNGFEVSKVIELYYDGEYFLLDTINKKWAYTNRNKYKNGIVKIYDFKDLLKYDNSNNQSLSGSYGIYAGYQATANKKHYKIIVYLNNDNIDESSIKLFDAIIASDSIGALFLNHDNTIEEKYNNLIQTLEYIKNHQ